MGYKGCQTCRARKVRCDGQRPVCNNCTKSQRFCKGYAIQLSWPKDGDKRRAVVAHKMEGPARYSQRNSSSFINVSSWDILISQTLEEGRTIIPYHHTLTPRSRRTLAPFHLGKDEAHLLEFFKESKSRLIAPAMDEKLADFVLHIALSNTSPMTNLALQALLAIAALRLQGHAQGSRYKTDVISKLAKSVTQLDRTSVLTNLIVTMLLYQYELFRPSGPSQQWNFFLCGAKQLLRGATTSNVLDTSESSALLDWIYYHEVSTEFSLRYWNVPQKMDAICKEGPLARPLDPGLGVMLSDESSAFKGALQLVSAVCRGTAKSTKNSPLRTLDMEQIRTLESRIYDSIGREGTALDNSATGYERQHSLQVLYQISALIYLNRAILQVPATSFQHRRLVREGMIILRKLETCESALPLFILACEAHEDEQRLEMLDIFSRMSNNDKQRSIHAFAIQSMVEAVWNQNDLDIEGSVSYTDTLDAVISTVDTVPLFA